MGRLKRRNRLFEKVKSISYTSANKRRGRPLVFEFMERRFCGNQNLYPAKPELTDPVPYSTSLPAALKVAKVFSAKQIMLIKVYELFKPGKQRQRVKACSVLCYWAVRELDINMVERCHRIKLSAAAVSLSVQRGEKIVRENNYTLVDNN